MNAMDLQLGVFQKTGTGTQVNRPVSGTMSVRPASGELRTPSFSDVLAALTHKNTVPRTAPASGRLRALEAEVSGRRASAAPSATAPGATAFSDVSGSTSDASSAAAAGRLPAAASALSAENSSKDAPGPEFDLSSRDARRILREALNSEEIPSELLNLLTDDNGDFSDSLLDLILADDEEEEITDIPGLSEGDISDQLTSVLTDARQAQELLSTQSGRELINAMAERSIAGLITG